MAQLGAEVIRFDPIGGGLDRRTLAGDRGGPEPVLGRPQQGQAIDPGRSRLEDGRELVTAMITAPGPDAGLFLTNFPARGFLDYERWRLGGRL